MSTHTKISDGKLLYQKLRIDTSDKNGRFKRRQPNGKGWKWNWDGLQLVPYNLDQLVNCGDDVHIPEGEHDCDTLTRLKFIATTNPESGSAPWKPEYTECLDATVRGVYIWRDQDATGRKHADDVAQSIHGHVPFVKIVDVPSGNDVSEFLDHDLSPKEQAAEVIKLCQQAKEWKPIAQPTNDRSQSVPNLDDVLNDDSFIEFAPEFLNGKDDPIEYLIAPYIAAGQLHLFHGVPRAMKTLAADEIMVALGTDTQAFGILTPARKCKVWRLAQEDPRNEEKHRIRSLLAARGITELPDTLAFSIHKGINLDSPDWQEKIIDAIKKNGFQLLIIDPIRRFSFKADKGPAEVSELTNYLRKIIVATGIAIIVIHHDVKPSASKEDNRRRGHKASGGDWFAAAECPIHFEKLSKNSALVVPEDFKFCLDPSPFSFQFSESPNGIQLIGKQEHEKEIDSLSLQNKIIEFLRNNSMQSGNKVAGGVHGKKEDVIATLEILSNRGVVDSAPGKRNANLWFLK